MNSVKIKNSRIAKTVVERKLAPVRVEISGDSTVVDMAVAANASIECVKLTTGVFGEGVRKLSVGGSANKGADKGDFFFQKKINGFLFVADNGMDIAGCFFLVCLVEFIKKYITHSQKGNHGKTDNDRQEPAMELSIIFGAWHDCSLY